MKNARSCTSVSISTSFESPAGLQIATYLFGNDRTSPTDCRIHSVGTKSELSLSLSATCDSFR